MLKKLQPDSRKQNIFFFLNFRKIWARCQIPEPDIFFNLRKSEAVTRCQKICLFNFVILKKFKPDARFSCFEFSQMSDVRNSVFLECWKNRNQMRHMKNCSFVFVIFRISEPAVRCQKNYFLWNFRTIKARCQMTEYIFGGNF